jgi:hypothetical protein
MCSFDVTRWFWSWSLGFLIPYPNCHFYPTTFWWTLFQVFLQGIRLKTEGYKFCFVFNVLVFWGFFWPYWGLNSWQIIGQVFYHLRNVPTSHVLIFYQLVVVGWDHSQFYFQGFICAALLVFYIFCCLFGVIEGIVHSENGRALMFMVPLF